jgi:hypothetical protein
MRTRWSAVAAASLVMALAVSAWAAPETVTLAMKGEPGEVRKCRSNVDFSMSLEVKPPGSGVGFSVYPKVTGWLTSVEEVRAVAANGDLTLAEQLESFDFTADVADLHLRAAIVGPNGGPPQLIKLPRLPLETVVSQRGKAVAIRGLEKLPIPALPGPGGKQMNLAEMLNGFLQSFSQPLYPAKAVRVGETWGWQMVVDPMEMMKKMGVPLPPEAQQQMPNFRIPIKSTSTLAGFETVGGVECAKVEAVAPWSFRGAPGPPGSPELVESGSTKTTTWLDYAAGHRMKEITEFEVNVSVGEGEAALMKMSMKGTVSSEPAP